MTALDRHGVLGERAPSSLADLADLGALREHIGDCTRCPLGFTRTCLVFGVGDPGSRLMFIGEAPGRNEDLKGEPFVGAAGKLLDELLASIGLERSQVYIANVLKCRPPGNRDPLAEEIATCTPFLAEQVRLISPDVIATLGNFATKYILGTELGITQLRGKLFHTDGRQVVPIFHPAAALYSPDKRQVLFDDFARLRSVLEKSEGTRLELRPTPAPAVSDTLQTSDSGEQPAVDQPSLF
ncbi:MAG: uracil-DNA glycosylase [Coriobacteriia bacterium]